MAYDVMKDIVVKQGIRNSMIEDMAKALAALADWQKTAKAQDFSRGAKGAQEYAANALRRYHEARAKL